jgi:cobalt-precorrin-5B (C1)-methyltransferase
MGGKTMKTLREGYTTGVCAAAAALASLLWQRDGVCPEQVSYTLPSGKTLLLPIEMVSDYVCGVRKDGGDDPDQTNGCLVCAQVQVAAEDGSIVFRAGDGVGTVTRKGLPIPVGEPAINPVPRKMITETVRSVIGERGATVTISVPDGKQIAERTFNARLGIIGGISILGTTGVVRPMSEEAVRESLRLELSMCRAEYGTACAFVTGYGGETYLKQQYPDANSIVLCSNYLGYLLDCAEEMGMRSVLLVGMAGKLVKPAADIMYLHSHTAGGQREVICTHAALAGATTEQIQQLYNAATTAHRQELLEKMPFGTTVWQTIAEAACENCRKRTHNTIQIGMILLSSLQLPLAETAAVPNIIKEWKTHAT